METFSFNHDKNSIYYSKELFIDYCKDLFKSYSTQRNLDFIFPNASTSPYILTMLQTTIKKILFPIVTNNNIFRTLQPTNYAKAEKKLFGITYSNPPSILTPLALKNYKVEMDGELKENTYLLPLTNLGINLKIDPTYKDTQALCYLLNDISHIFYVDLILLLDSDSYVRQCCNPDCKKLHITKRKNTFACSSKCNKSYQHYIQTASPVWYKYKQINAFVDQRINRHSTEAGAYKAYIQKATDIFNEYLNTNFSSADAINKLARIDYKIKETSQKFHTEYLAQKGSLLISYDK